jgi:hypothetical protein
MEIKEFFPYFTTTRYALFTRWNTDRYYFNPLGVPSRMNVGQVFECLLGLAGEKLGNRFKVTRLMKFMEKKHHVYLSIKTERGCN